MFIPFLGEMLVNKISFNLVARGHQSGDTHVLTGTTVAVAGDVLGSLAIAEAGESESADALQACLYLLDDRQSPRLLVSAGSASSCLQC